MIYLFDKNERLIKIIRKKAIKAIAQKQMLTDTRYVSDRLTVEFKALSSELLDTVEYIAIPTRKDSRKFHLYFLATHETSDNITTLEGTQTGIEELRKVIVEDKKPRNRSVKDVVDDLLLDTNWSARYVTDTAFGNTNFYYISVFEALQKACEVWDVEMQFFVEMSNNQIGARYIDFKRQLGKKTGTRLVYGTNALTLVRQSEKTDLITAAIGRGKGEEVSSAEENESGYAGYGRKINFADIEWVKGSQPVDKPLGQKYVEIKEATERFGVKRSDGMYPKIGIIEIETDDKQELIRRTFEELKKLCRPQATYKASAAYLKDAEIGDTIRVVRKDWELDYETRIFEITWDRLSNKATSITLGDRLSVSEAKRARQLSQSIDGDIGDAMSRFRSIVMDHLTNADGFTTNWYREDVPPVDKTKVGDIWYKPDPEHEGQKIMYMWDGENWIEILRTASNNALKEELDNLKAESEQFEKDFEAGLAEVGKQASQKADELKKSLEAKIKTETQPLKDSQAQFEEGMRSDRAKLIDFTKRLVDVAKQVDAGDADIKRLNSEVSSKVSQTSYDTLRGRVTSAESLIQQQANAINQRLTATQVESAITVKGYQTSSQVNNAITSKGYQTKADVDSNIAGRGFATATTLDNKVRETVEGYTREISRVEGLIPTETTGNLLLNSNVVLKDVESMTYEIAETLVRRQTYTITSYFLRGTGSQGHTGTIKGADGNVIIKNANGTDQYFTLTYNGKLNSWVVTIKPTVNIPKGSRLQLFSHPENSKGNVSFVTMVKGIVPLSSWQPHWSEQATVTALNAVKSTADEHTRTLTSLQNDTLKKAEVSITSDKIVLGVGKEINGRTFSTMIAQNSQYVDIIAEKLRVSGNMIVDGTITSKDLAVGSVTAAQIVANSVTADKIATNAVTADKLLADQALFNKLKANQAYLKTLFTTDAFAQTVKTIELNADKITAGTLNAAKTNVINLNASNITSGTMSANLIKGGVLKALNNNTIFDLNNGNITFNTSSSIIFNQSGNALKRTRNGSTAFMHFSDSAGGGVYAGFGVTSHNEGVKSQNTSRFAGVRAFRDNDAHDQVEIFGDKILIGHAFATNAHALWITPTGLKATVDLIDFMRWCRTEILRLHNVKTTQTAYTYNVWGEF